jgi:hypothetical protein
MWTKESIIQLLDRSDKAVERAIVAIYNRQTEDEQNSSSTTHRNGRGFNGFHARSGTYYAKWILSGRHLTGTYLIKARAMSKHYVAQLLEEAQQKFSVAA